MENKHRQSTSYMGQEGEDCVSHHCHPPHKTHKKQKDSEMAIYHKYCTMPQRLNLVTCTGIKWKPHPPYVQTSSTCPRQLLGAIIRLGKSGRKRKNNHNTTIWTSSHTVTIWPKLSWTLTETPKLLKKMEMDIPHGHNQTMHSSLTTPESSS